MNPDRVIGTAVLVTSGPVEWLFYLRVGRNITGIGRDSLPVMPEGGPPPAVPLPAWFPENRPWKYRVEGTRLAVHPSINISNGWWHNDGAWSVDFVPATGAAHADHVRQLISANPALELGHLLNGLATD